MEGPVEFERGRIADVELGPVVETDEAGQVLGGGDERGGEVDAGHVTPGRRRDPAGRSPEAAADVEHSIGRRHRECVDDRGGGRRAAEVELVGGREIVDREVVGSAESVDDRRRQVVDPFVVMVAHRSSRGSSRRDRGGTYCRWVRRLEGPELVAYDVLPRALAKRVRVVEVPLLPNGADGMTVGPIIFLRDDRSTEGDRALLAHELVHVRQFAEQGAPRFLLSYVRDYLRGRRRGLGHRQAYLDIEAEQEARAEEDAWRRRHGAPH